MPKRKVKKGKYEFVSTQVVRFDEMYLNSKPDLAELVAKYHGDDGDPLLFRNNPIARFAVSCAKLKKEEFAELAPHHKFVKMSCERYQVFDDTYVVELIVRMNDIVRSIEKNGYARDKHKGKHVCATIRPNGGYEIISGKHRAAACFALGYKSITCDVYRTL